MKNQDQIVREELRKFIKKSCTAEAISERTYRKFHTSLLKFFFSAVDVLIDYDEQSIFLYNTKPLTNDPVKLFFLHEAMKTTVSYDNLEETLKGCLEQGTKQTKFYHSLLLHYNLPEHTTKNPDTLSA